MEFCKISLGNLEICSFELVDTLYHTRLFAQYDARLMDIFQDNVG